MTRFMTGLGIAVLLGWALAAPTWADGSTGAEARDTLKGGDKKKDAKGRTDKKEAKKKSAEAEPKKEQPKPDQGKTQEAKKPEAKADAAKPDAAKPDEKKPDAAKPEEKKPATYKVKKRSMRIEVSLEGLFEALKTSEVALRADEWSDFQVLKAVEHGATVRKGDLLVQFDLEKIDRAIADLQRDQQVSRLAMLESETQLQALRTAQPLDAALVERGKRLVEEDMAYFLKVDRLLSEKMANFMAKLAENYLAYEQEELRQLEKMYKADDLVEETEEIILRRARDQVERAKFSLERAQIDRDQILKTTIPRQEELMKITAQQKEIDYKKNKTLLPVAEKRLELSIEKAKTDLARSEERFKRLQRDREQMTVKAPADGIVYLGRCVRGKWAGGELLADKLRRGGRVQNEDVFMTVVESRPLAVRTSVSEKQLPNVTPGAKAAVTPSAFPDVRLTAIVQQVAVAPSSTQSFDTTLTVSHESAPAALMPGMTCQVKLTPYDKSDALAVPVAAVNSDDTADVRKYQVALPGKEGKIEKRDVTIGKRSDKLVEIAKGLAEGDEILAEFPKDKD